MDPTTNPIPTPNPVPNPSVPPVEPSVTPVAPQSTPVNPVIEPTQPAVNPVVTPTQPIENPVVTPTNLDPVGATFQPGGLDGVAATDPIMMPEPVAKPDPIEEELKAPMKAAAPVPGSIGSAVSGPEAVTPVEEPIAPVSTGQTVVPEATVLSQENVSTTPSVSFTDPATTPEVNPATEAPQPVKKSSRTTLIVLVVVAFVIVVALAVVLVMQLMPSQQNEPSNPVSPTPEPTPTPVIEPTKLSCSRSMTEEELATFKDAQTEPIDGVLSGNIVINMEFDENDKLSTIEEYKNVTNESLEATDEEPLGNSEAGIDSVSMSVDDLDAENIGQFYLSYDENGEFATSKDDLQEDYEQLDFVCEAL